MCLQGGIPFMILIVKVIELLLLFFFFFFWRKSVVEHKSAVSFPKTLMARASPFLWIPTNS